MRKVGEWVEGIEGDRRSERERELAINNLKKERTERLTSKQTTM